MCNRYSLFVLALSVLSLAAMPADAQFNRSTNLEASSAQWGDFDGDGDLDLATVVYDSGYEVRFFEYDGGAFAQTAEVLNLAGSRALLRWADFDSDGDLDLLANNELYTNDGSGSFTLAQTLDPGYNDWGFENAGWGDFDNDGDLDLLISRAETRNSYETVLYRNDGAAFTDANLSAFSSLGLAGGDAEWGDYDADGDLDLALSGWAGRSSGEGRTYLYNNSGGFLSRDTGTDFVDGYNGTLDWGDVDADGDLDLLVNGSGNTVLYIYDGDNFAAAGAGFTGTTDGGARFFDYDADGDLDVIVSGVPESGPDVTEIYVNDGTGAFTENTPSGLYGMLGRPQLGDYDADGDVDLYLEDYIWEAANSTLNTAPTAPANLAVTFEGQDATFTWDAASDAETPAEMLTYSLRIGTTPGGTEIATPQALPDGADEGRRLVPDFGMHGPTESLTIEELPEGTYYWSVHAVDAGFAGSAFAGEQEFTLDLPPSPPNGLEASADDGSVTLTWNANTEPDLNGYVVYRGTSADATTEIAQVEAGTTNYTDTGLTNGTTYYYEVTALDAGGTESTPTGASAVPFERMLFAIGADLTGISGPDLDWGDFDGDGDLDLLAVGQTNTGFAATIYDQDGGAFAPAVQSLPDIDGRAHWEDLDMDGDVDLLLVGTERPSFDAVARVYENDGGTLTARTDFAAESMELLTTGDMDRDGDVDLLLHSGGSSSDPGPSYLYINDGDLGFTQTATPTEADEHITAASAADYDADGDLDFIARVYNTTRSVYSYVVYTAEDDGSFSSITYSGIPNVRDPSFAWADYDADGDLDLALTGYSSSGDFEGNTAAALLENVDSRFRTSSFTPTAVERGEVDWADYDGDGDPDLLVTGVDANFAALTALYRNDGSGDFTLVESGLPDASVSGAAWGDYDGDGDVDLVLAGIINNVRSMRIFRNDAGDGTNNGAPPAPTALSATTSGARASLSWTAPTGDETPAAGLTYALRVGTTPGGMDVASPNALMDAGMEGRRLVARSGPATGTVAVLSDLEPGTYYWSVQAVDASLVGGAFASEGTFEIEDLAPPTNLTAQGGADAVTLGWTASSTANRAGYVIYRGTSPAPTTPLDTTAAAATTYRDASAEVGTTYYYRVTTLSSDDQESAFTDDASGYVPLFVKQDVSDFQGNLYGATAWADYNRDGLLDLLEGADEQVTVLRNAGDALVEAFGITSLDDVEEIIVADFDRDGVSDLIVTRTNAGADLRPTSLYYEGIGGDECCFDYSANIASLRSYASTDVADYDGDGDLDVLITGFDGSDEAVTQLYRNDTGTGAAQPFNPVTTTLPGIASAGGAHWGDYDADGDPDVIVSGDAAVGGETNMIAKLFRNDDGTFVEVSGTDFEPGGAKAWADFDNDGDLDLFAAASEPVLYLNEGGSFTAVAQTALDAGAESVEVGDFDADGDRDVLLRPAAERIVLARNDGTGTFEPVMLTDLPPVGFGSSAWGDYDEDGDLDLAVAGFGDSGNVTGGVYANNLNVVNAAPQAPSGLDATTDTSSVTLSWQAGSDTETPTPGLTYSLYVRVADADTFAVAPEALLDSGQRIVVRPGNAGHASSYTLHDLEPGVTYTWSVQTVDAGFASSAYAAEGSFTMPSSVDAEVPSGLPETFALHGNYPNPFTPQTTIRYDLPVASDVRLTVYDALGREVAVLVDTKQPGGEHTATFEASHHSSGVYFYHLDAGEHRATGRMVLVK